VRRESDPLAHWPDRVPLYGDGDRLLVVYTGTESARTGRRWADGVWRPASTPIAAARDAALDVFAGWLVSTADLALANELIAAGATQLRHAHVMSHDLVAAHPVATDSRLRIEPLGPAQVDRHAHRLGELSFAAYPPGHPDHQQDTEQSARSQMHAIARGEVLGPMMAESRVALAKGQIIGACLVVDRPGKPSQGGPWIVELFRDPSSSAKGVGRSLLSAVLTAARDRALPGLSLAVSHDNARAKQLYLGLGFTGVAESWTLDLPS